MDQSKAATTDADIRITSLQAALTACNKPNSDPLDVIEVARDVYLFLTNKDPVLDFPADCCGDKVVYLSDYDRDEDGNLINIGHFDE